MYGYVPAHEILVIIAYAQMYLINAHSGISIKARGLSFVLSHHLHPYFVYASSGGSGESVHMHRLAWAFAARWNDKYRILVHWPKLCITVSHKVKVSYN